jgi:hypothetical protein
MISQFRWDHNAWGSSWAFLFMSIPLYFFLILFLKLLLLFRKKPLPLGSIPAIYNFMVLSMSAAIFVGCLVATSVEIKETRRIWRKSLSAVEWMVCFPLGTRPSGRVFFWSYLFYLTKYFQLLDTLITLLRKRPLTFLHIFHHIMAIFTCFFWLEFSQSLQILGILTNTLVYVIVYTYFFFRSRAREMPEPPPHTWLAGYCQIAQFGVTFVAYIGLLRLHFGKAGCNGMGSWLFNACFNAALFFLSLNFYRKMKMQAHHLKNP